MISVDIEGLAGLDAALQSKSAEFRTQLEAAVGEAADAVRSDAQSLVPRDSGTLHDAIGVSHDGLEAEVGVMDEEAYYGFWIEFGRKARPATPFLGPAAELELSRFAGRIGGALS